jgi:preprotein translocase SecF subunit
MDFAGKRKWFFLISLLVILPGMVFLAPPIDGLKAGLDFTGGSSITLLFSESVDQEDVRTVMADLGHPDAIVQGLGDNTYFIRTKELSTEEKNVVVAGVNEALEPSFASVGRTDADGRVALTIPSEPGGVSIRAESGERTGRLIVDTDDVTPSGELVMSLEPGPNEGEVVLTVSDGAPVANVLVTIGGVEVIAFDGVSPSVAEETVRNAFFAVLLAAVGIFLYVWWAFRNVPSPFRYSAAAIVALLHDTAIVVGIFAILGELLDVEVNLMFMIALLTVIGYSVNDTIVVFDRLRENVLNYPNRTLTDNVNVSISETISRSLNTSLTLLFTLLALLLLGGSTIREFLLVLLIGVVVGTYSSIGIASQMLVAWDQGDFRRLFRFRRPA